MHNIISSSSKGNSVIYQGRIMVDCGVPYSIISDRVRDIDLLLLTHSHGDHINLSTIKKMQLEKPSLRIGCCEWMIPLLEGVRNIDKYNIGGIYQYGEFTISPIKLYHDVPNCGYRIFAEGNKILHATDTKHLIGITAKGYDLYALECNYDEETVLDIIEAKESRGEFSHERGAVNSHLSEQQAYDFFFKNKKEDSILLRLHE
jgi:phosphoribosyl 1,2-cyclic phosphodiesterase